MTMKDLMIDLETFSTRNDAAIVSIGAVFFNRETGEMGQKFYRLIDNPTGHIDPNTVRWWLQQNEEARGTLNDPNRYAEHIALEDLGRYIQERAHLLERVWANDPDFDLTILQSAYERNDMPLPWSFRSARSMRTMIDISTMFGLALEPVRGGTHHNALDDAIHQAKGIIALWDALSDRMSAASNLDDLCR